MSSRTESEARALQIREKGSTKKMHNQYYVYILSSGKNRAIYVGFTSDLLGRVFEHKEKIHKGYTRSKGINQLVYFEIFEDIDIAISR